MRMRASFEPPAPGLAKPIAGPLVCAILVAGTWLLFSRALGYGFLDYDDPDFVSGNAHVQAGLTWAGLRWAFTSGGSAANWQPLTWLSLMLDRTLFGDGARAFHAENIGWHALSAALAFLALRRLTGAFRTSAVAAALFAWHPLRVESVAWISERKDVLSVFFGLAALWAYAGYAARRREDSPGAARWYALALAAFAGGLLCKAMLVTLPFVFLLLDAWPLGRGRLGARALLREKIPFLLLSAASAAVTYAVQDAGGAVSRAFPPGERLANAVVSVARYLGKFFWPFDLAVCYPHPARWPVASVLGAVLLALALTGLALGQWRRRPWILVGWLWFLGMLVPVIGLVQAGMQAMADRYLYLPGLGLELALLWTARQLPAPRRAQAALAAAVLAACAARTWSQLGPWRDSRALFEHALAVTPGNYLAHSLLATTLLNAGQPADAATECRRALELDPDYAPAHLGLGLALERLGRGDEALARYRRALELRPDYAPAHYRLAALLLHRGEFAEARAHFERAARLQPDFAATQLGRALAAGKLGRSAEALAACRRAVELQPRYPEAQDAWANLLADLGRPEEAWLHYEEALRLNPAFAEAHFNYANSLREAGRAGPAREHYLRAIALNPGDAEAQFGLGVALEALGRPDGGDGGLPAGGHPGSPAGRGAL